MLQEMQIQEKKKGEKQKSEYFQTQWRKHVDKLTIPPKQAPVYLAVSKGPSKEKKHRTGEESPTVRKTLGHICEKRMIIHGMWEKSSTHFIYLCSHRVGWLSLHVLVRQRPVIQFRNT